MTRINLLPWRTERLEEQKQKFFMLLGGCCLLALVFILLLHLLISGFINGQEKRNNVLLQENKMLDTRISEIEDLKQEKQHLIARMNIIESLQQNRAQAVHVFDELVKIMPNGAYLVSAKRESAPEPVVETSKPPAAKKSPKNKTPAPLDKIVSAGDTITLEGRAQSNTDISNLMRDIEASQWFTKPTLNVIKNDDTQAPYVANFTMSMQLKVDTAGQPKNDSPGNKKP